MIDDLIAIRLGSPRGWYSAGGKKVLGAPWDSMARTPISPAHDLAFCVFGLFQGKLLGEINDTIQFWPVAIQARQIQACQLHRRDPPGTDQTSQLRDIPEGQVINR